MGVKISIVMYAATFTAGGLHDDESASALPACSCVWQWQLLRFPRARQGSRQCWIPQGAHGPGALKSLSAASPVPACILNGALSWAVPETMKVISGPCFEILNMWFVAGGVSLSEP